MDTLPDLPWIAGLLACLALAASAWALSLPLRNIAVVDAFWGPMVVAPALVATLRLPATGPRAGAVLLLAGAWAVRLAAYMAWRAHGQPEDRRYQAIRARNQPNFELKSLYLVFGLQALLAWIVSQPLVAAVASPRGWQALDVLGVGVFLAGFAWESIADWQLVRFRAGVARRGQVLDTGLWRYSRHPNYFGECCAWWGLWLVAAGAGAAWTIASPALMTFLLVRVSGVPMLERDQLARRPAYADYQRRTNAFIPGPPRP